jgi:putative CocE/NonD family hydrolase
MNIVTALPRAMRVVEHFWIPTRDGTRLAAKMWLPEDAEAAPVPAVLEYIPYRKRDSFRARDHALHAYVAGHGYACVRVDLRGSGDSEGLLDDEYLPQEQQDGVDVIAWLARQPWCTGRVGMIGISWGGFNGLQIAALRPPALGAVISVGSTDDRYATDVHYLGGCMVKDNPDWGAVMFSHVSTPPDPAIVGERWREMWLGRLNNLRPWLLPWIEHQRRDAYWRQGSVCEDFGTITVPVYAINGWADNYAASIPRLLAGLKGPRKGLIGPWAHNYPHNGRPGPAIGFLQECVRWWDRWLKDKPNGIMDEPMLRVWMQASVPPRVESAERPGRWVAEATWPSPRLTPRTFALNPGRLDAVACPAVALTLRSPQTTGLTAGELGRYGSGAEFASDQRDDDGGSLLFVSEPLAEPLEILGEPVVSLTLASDRPFGFVAARLNDVAPDGASTRVTYGVLNLAHSKDHARVLPLEPGKTRTFDVPLEAVAHAFPAGHRLAIAVSNAYWPLIWPSPAPATLTIMAGSSRLVLPVRPADPADERLASFEEPACAAAPPAMVLAPAPDNNRVIVRDPLAGTTTVTLPRSYGTVRLLDIELDIEELGSVVYTLRDEDPTSATCTTDWQMARRRGGWSVRTATWTRLSCTATDFRLEASLDAWEGGEKVLTRHWDTVIPRDGL